MTKRHRWDGRRSAAALLTGTLLFGAAAGGAQAQTGSGRNSVPPAGTSAIGAAGQAPGRTTVTLITGDVVTVDTFPDGRQVVTPRLMSRLPLWETDFSGSGVRPVTLPGTGRSSPQRVNRAHGLMAPGGSPPATHRTRGPALVESTARTSGGPPGGRATATSFVVP